MRIEVSRRRLIVKVFVLTVLFSGILFFLYKGETPALPGRWNHTSIEDSGTEKPWPYLPWDDFSWAAFTWSLSGLKEEVDADLQEILNSLWLTEHNSAIVEAIARKKYTDMCRVFWSFCQVVNWDWSFSFQEHYYYQGLFISLSRYLDKTVQYSPHFSQNLSRITFYKDNTWRRWWADHTKVRINTKIIPTNREFWEVLSHEAGHIIDFSSMRWWVTPALDPAYTEFGRPQFYVDDPSLEFYRLSRKNEFVRHADASYKDFVSWYAMEDPFEDLAETFNMYINHYDLFIRMTSTSDILKKKFSFVERLFLWYKWHPLIPQKTSSLDPTERFRDTTKLYTEVSS